MKIYFDVEATGLEPWSRVHIFCAQIDEQPTPVVLYSKEEARKFLFQYLNQPNVTIIGHNIIGYDFPLLYHDSPLPRIKCTIFDTLIYSKLLYPYNKFHGLESWGERIVEQGYKGYEKVEVAKDQWDGKDKELMRSRCLQDVKITKKVYEILSARPIEKINLIDRMFIPHFLKATCYGIPILLGRAFEIDKELKHKIEERKATSPVTKMGSAKAWAEYFKSKGHAPIITEKGNPSLKEDNIDYYVGLAPEMKLHFEHKKDVKLSTAFDLSNEAQKKKLNIYSNTRHTSSLGMRLYPTWKYFATRTLRTHCVDPYVNSFPKGGLVRSAIGFGEHDYYKLVGIDIVQLEMAILGYLLETECGDSRIAKWVADPNISPKKMTLDIFGSLFDKVPEEEREDRAKKLNYATIYGQTVGGNANVLGITLDGNVDEKIKVARRKRFPSLDAYTKMLEGRVKNGRLTNMYGYPVATQNIKDTNPHLNTMVQSSGECFAKLLFAYIMDDLSLLHSDIHMILKNHDEVQVAVPRHIEDSRIHWAVETAQHKFSLDKYKKHPLITGVDVKIGNTWNETH